MLIDTDVNSRFHSSTHSSTQTTTKYEQVLYWRHTCIYFLAVFYKRCLNIHGLPATFQKLINHFIRGIGVGRGSGNNRFGNKDNWWVHLHCIFQVISKIIYRYCTLLSNWDNGERRSRGASCHCKGTLGRWPYLEKMLLFDCYLLCPSTVSLNLQRQTLWHTSGLRQLVNERLYPLLWMKGYSIWRLTAVIHTLGLTLH